MSRARGRTVGALEPFPLASGLTCDCKPGSATALFGSVRSRRSLARTSGPICIAYCSFVGPATESANVVLSGGRSCLSGCFFRRPGLTRRKGGRSRIARRFLLSSVRKRKMRRRLGPAAGSPPQSVCSEIGERHCAGERDFAGTFVGFVLMLSGRLREAPGSGGKLPSTIFASRSVTGRGDRFAGAAGPKRRTPEESPCRSGCKKRGGRKLCRLARFVRPSPEGTAIFSKRDIPSRHCSTRPALRRSGSVCRLSGSLSCRRCPRR